jgi:hypothetical protein
MSRSRESVGGVLALFGGLALLGMTFSGQCSRSAQAIEEEPFLNEVFDPVGSPLGWKVDGCESVPDGRVMLRYSPLGDATPEFVADEQEAEALSKMPKRMGKMQPKPWGHLKQREGFGPSGALLVRHPIKTSLDQRKKLFRGLNYKGIESLNFMGEALPMDGGRIPWGPYEVPWVHLRHFERVDGEPTFHDTLRVDLTSGPRALILHLAFPPRARARHEDLEPFVAAWLPPALDSGQNPEGDESPQTP